MHYKITFQRYFFTRFIKYLLSVNLLLVFLFNFIEFFEKLLRSKHSSIHDILWFFVLNLIPSFFEQLPTSCWLATCLLLREFYLQQEFDTLLLLGVNLRTLFRLFAFIGVCLALTSFAINDFFITKLTLKAEQYKMEHFKQISTQKIINKWIILEQNKFCYFSVLDINKHSGKDFMFVFITPQFILQKIMSASLFTTDEQNQTIKLQEGTIIDIEHNLQKKALSYTIKSPSFFSQVKINGESSSVINCLKNLFFYHSLMPITIKNDILGLLFKRIIVYLSLIIYPIFTFGLFGLMWRRSTYRWLIVFFPYPFLTIFALFIETLLNSGCNAFLANTPYLVLFISIYILFRKLQ
jgi:lipopolysaccharide export LptBFGC system permease protein LptF